MLRSGSRSHLHHGGDAPRVGDGHGHPILPHFGFSNPHRCHREGLQKNYPVSDTRHSQPRFSRTNSQIQIYENLGWVYSTRYPGNKLGQSNYTYNSCTHKYFLHPHYRESLSNKCSGSGLIQKTAPVNMQTTKSDVKEVISGAVQ